MFVNRHRRSVTFPQRVVSAPPTHYTHSGDASIAYQTVGDGPCDLVVVNGPASHLELIWEEPRTARTFRTMAQFARLIMFDRRGTGLSDPVSAPPTLEQQVDDLKAVLAATGSDRVSMIGGSDLGLSALFAATYPEQVTALVLSGVAADGSPHAGGAQPRGGARRHRAQLGRRHAGVGVRAQPGGQPRVRGVVGAAPALGGQPRDGPQADGHDRADQPEGDPAHDQRPHPGPAQHRGPRGPRRVRPRGGEPHPRRALHRIRRRGRLHVV